MTNDDAPTQRTQALGPSTRSGYAAGQVVFSRYTLEAQIGRGGMGVVWRARDGKLDRPVALKFLPPEVAADAEAVRDLKLETRRCLELTHANIVRVYDFIEEDSGAAIAMEYVEGESLAKIKANAPGGCIAAADLTPFVAQLCAALRYAHQVAKIAHHDLKPANVLVTLDGVLKITDFGIARSLTETQTRLTGKIGNTSGTLYYMSPQQIAGEKPTASDDLYALGAMLYELLAGKTPFFRGDAFSVRQQVLERAPAPLEAHRREVGCTGAEIPAAWSETILACLAKKPEGRPASADEVAMRLGVALEPMATTRGGVTLTSLSGRTLGGGTGPLPPARRSLVPWLLAIGSAVIALTGAGIYFGIYVPEQERLVAEAERAHRAELKLQAERAHRAEEQRLAAEAQAREERKKQEEARAQLAKDQEENTAMMARIAALSDTTPQMKINETNRAVRDYLRVAPAAYRDQVEKAWNDRQAAWRAIAAANRPGTVVVETDPAGATVVLYPRNLRKQSPALFEDVKPGDVSLHIEKDGFESKDVPYAVKLGVTNKLDLIKLTAIYGNATITSDPPDLYVVVEGNGKRVDGRTPFDTPWLPPGNYTVSYQRRGWRNPVVKNLIIERGKQTKVSADLNGFNLVFRSVPAGATVSVDNGTPFTLTEPLPAKAVEPRTFQITAVREGYEPYSKAITVTKNDTIVIQLTEKPLPHALRRIIGTHWHYESFSTNAELNFNLQGHITGTHRAVLGSTERDVGAAESFNATTNTFTAYFTNNPKYPLYAGTVQIKIVDDDHLAVSWTIDGSKENLVFEREKVKKP